MGAYFVALVALGVLGGVGGVALLGGSIGDWPAAAFSLAGVPISIMGGRALLSKMGLLQLGYGRSLVEQSPHALLTGLAVGIGVGTPWALANLLFGSGQDAWVRSWTQVLGALAPGIIEEAWARVFLISLLAYLFTSLATTRAALTAASLVGSCWFGYLHQTPGLLSAHERDTSENRT